MKYLLFLFLTLSPVAFADAYWDCQCFESKEASDTLGGVEVSTEKAETVGQAEEKAVESCKAEIDRSTTVASCHRYVRADH